MKKLDLLTARIVGWLREELTRLRAKASVNGDTSWPSACAGDQRLTAAWPASQRQWLQPGPRRWCGQPAV